MPHTPSHVQAQKRKRAAAKPPARKRKGTRRNPSAESLLTAEHLPDDPDSDATEALPPRQRMKPTQLKRAVSNEAGRYQTKRGLVEGTKVWYNTAPGISEEAAQAALAVAEIKAKELQGDPRKVVAFKVLTR